MIEQQAGVGVLEIVARIFLLGLQEHVAIGDLVLALAAVEVEIEHAVDALHIHGEALKPVGQLARDGIAVEAADLLEIGELRHLHAVEPDLPAEPPGAERRALPVVLDEADVVLQGIDADGDRGCRDRGPGGRAATASGSPGTGSSAGAGSGSRRSGRPWAGGKAAHRRRARAWAQASAAWWRDERSRPHLHVVRLEDDAALIGPEALELEDQVLEGRRPLSVRLGQVFGQLAHRGAVEVGARNAVSARLTLCRPWRGRTSHRLTR